MKDPGEFWDEMYDVEHYRYGTAPNEFLVEIARDFPDGARVLCVGDGEGRNGVWLAEKGFEVTTIEPSRIGVRKAHELAEHRGVTLDIREGRFPDQLGKVEVFDVVLLTYVHLPPSSRETLHRAIIEHLAPAGRVVLEAFRPAQLKYESGGPKDVDKLYTPAILRSDFAALNIELLDETVTDLDEGPGHSGPAAVVRMVAFDQ